MAGLKWLGDGASRPAVRRAKPDLGWLVSGDLRRPVEAEEMQTFVRRRGGGWLLSANQQV